MALQRNRPSTITACTKISRTTGSQSMSLAPFGNSLVLDQLDADQRCIRGAARNIFSIHKLLAKRLKGVGAGPVLWPGRPVNSMRFRCLV
jgi:hypothetical protein